VTRLFVYGRNGKGNGEPATAFEGEKTKSDLLSNQPHPERGQARASRKGKWMGVRVGRGGMGKGSKKVCLPPWVNRGRDISRRG